MTKRWCKKAIDPDYGERLGNEIESSEKVEFFLKDIFEIYDKHGLSISHEDCHGSFLIEFDSKYNREWLYRASINEKPEDMK